MFKFALQAVLDHRQRNEEQIQVELAGLRRVLKEEREKLERIVDEERNNLINLNTAQDVTRPVTIIATLIGRGEALRNNFRKQQESLERAGRNLEECRNRLVEAMKEREILEKLKEKQQKTYILKRERRELKISDEAGRSQAGKGGRP